jgi:hypothetical protein
MIIIIISIAHKVHSENSPVQTSIRLSATKTPLTMTVSFTSQDVSDMSPESSPTRILQHYQKFHNKTITYKD